MLDIDKALGLSRIIKFTNKRDSALYFDCVQELKVIIDKEYFRLQKGRERDVRDNR